MNKAKFTGIIIFEFNAHGADNASAWECIFNFVAEVNYNWINKRSIHYQKMTLHLTNYEMRDCR